MTTKENTTAWTPSGSPEREAALEATIYRLQSDNRMFKWHVQRNKDLQDQIARLEQVIEIRNMQIEALGEGLAKREARIEKLRQSLVEADARIEGLKEDLAHLTETYW